MSKIQEELVREAILAVCFPLVEKQGKGEKIRGATVQSESGQLKIQLPSVQRRKQSAQEQLTAVLWLVEKGTGPLSQGWWQYSNVKQFYYVINCLIYRSIKNTSNTNGMQMRFEELACDLHTH